MLMVSEHRRALFAACLWASVAVALLVGCVVGVGRTATFSVEGAIGGVVAAGFKAVTVPKPLHASQPWAQRQAAFGWRTHEVFGIPLDRATEFAGWILEAADRQQLAPELIASLVFTESSFRKQVRSRAGAIGPAQVKPGYWADFCGARDLWDPEQNVYCGAQVLAHLKERCGNLECALASYNVGFNARQRQSGLRYVSRIEHHRSKLDQT